MPAWANGAAGVVFDGAGASAALESAMGGHGSVVRVARCVARVSLPRVWDGVLPSVARLVRRRRVRFRARAHASRTRSCGAGVVGAVGALRLPVGLASSPLLTVAFFFLCRRCSVTRRTCSIYAQCGGVSRIAGIPAVRPGLSGCC